MRALAAALFLSLCACSSEAPSPAIESGQVPASPPRPEACCIASSTGGAGEEERPMSSPTQWPPKREDDHDPRSTLVVVGYGIAILGLFVVGTWLLLSGIF